MKITDLYGLGVNQREIDFVDIDPDRDLPLFIDPFFLGTRTDSWSVAASRTVRNFFETFVAIARSGDHVRARALFDHLHEPNETCLGLSKYDPKGRAIGERDANKLFQSIIGSRAIESGVVEDLEDFRIFIPGIDKDKVSDMTTNIIRRHLIEYTANQCRLWGIPLVPGIASEFYWDAVGREWTSAYHEALVIGERKILLTPKSVVSFVRRYTPRKYHRSFVLEFLRHEHLAMGSSLVEFRKNGAPFVTKKSLEEHVAPYSKEYLAAFTAAHPDIFKEFKQWAESNASPIEDDEISRARGSLEGGEVESQSTAAICRYLAEKLADISPGNAGASRYHRVCVSILEFLLYPNVTCPTVELEINEGRKRIDIVFDNAARSGFFHRVHAVGSIPAQFVSVECKNYSKDVANPELDQLIGRFSVNHGKVGLLLFRSIDDEQALIARCNDAYVAQQGLIIPISDRDIAALLTSVAAGDRAAVDQFFADRYRIISMNARSRGS
jgi:hypothetical protein